jgi:hypothetical protein
MGLLSLRAYAKHRGVTLQAVRKAIDDGRIQTTTDPNGKVRVDPAAADKAWEETTDPAKQRKPEADASAKTPPSDYSRARAMREAYLANLAKITYEEKIGKLVEADAVKKAIFEASRITRDALLNIPNRISPQLASETDPHEVHLLLEAEITRALEELANALRSSKLNS